MNEPPNSSMILLAADSWKAQTSSPSGMMVAGGGAHPLSPLSSMAIVYGIPATPRAQSMDPPLAGYRRHGIQPTS